MSRRSRRTAPVRGVLLFAVAAVLSGCGGAGQLHDAGPARPVALHPVSEPLWPAEQSSAEPSPSASGSRPPLTPVPGITAVNEDVHSVDVPALVAKDPGLRPEETKALTGCQGCGVRPAQYRDLNGDGRPELLTAVVFSSGSSYLHVYELRGARLYPVLAQQVESGFTAETVGPKLVVHEPDRTRTTYAWEQDRLVVEDRQITGPGADGAYCEPTALPPAKVEVHPEPKVSMSPTPAPQKPAPKPTLPVPVPSKPAA
ncbi:hypothetical protein ACIA8O_07530 [Kitasatospora sp. NPDC051853]|uniref:hypothetical protein n=1 Tax=Kitasatospora sp. NPDC051853 TaxID=3364058 RepID=UPI00378AF378